MKSSKRPKPSTKPLPSTVIPLGEAFDHGLITSSAASTISHLTVITIGDASSNTATNCKNRYPYHFIDIHYFKEGKPSILLRSKELRMTRKKLRTVVRATRRQLADFLFNLRSQA